MLSFDDPTWTTLTGGHGRVTDVRPLLRRLEVESDPDDVWEALWDALHHQGDIGVASFVAVPHLVRIHRQRGTIDWNTYALIARSSSLAMANRTRNCQIGHDPTTKGPCVS